MAPVSDRATAPVMIALHEGLRRGERPSVALSSAAPGAEALDAWASWMAFAAYGAG